MKLDPYLVASYLAAIAFEMLFPLLLAIWLRRRLEAAWRHFGFGAAVFAASQLFTRIPAMKVTELLLRRRFEASASLRLGWLISAAFTAGLFEEGGRFLGYRLFWRSSAPTWDNAVMYGVGHGGLESMVLVGGLSVLGLINTVVLSSMDLSAVTQETKVLRQVRKARRVIAGLPSWAPLLGALERLFSMAVHVSLSVLVLQCFVRRDRRWLLLAMGYHGVTNLAAMLTARAMGSGGGAVGRGDLVTEGVVALFAVVSLWIALRLRPARREPQE